jgi:hypothetical protein
MIQDACMVAVRHHVSLDAVAEVATSPTRRHRGRGSGGSRSLGLSGIRVFRWLGRRCIGGPLCWCAGWQRRIGWSVGGCVGRCEGRRWHLDVELRSCAQAGLPSIIRYCSANDVIARVIGRRPAHARVVERHDFLGYRLARRVLHSPHIGKAGLGRRKVLLEGAHNLEEILIVALVR